VESSAVSSSSYKVKAPMPVDIKEKVGRKVELGESVNFEATNGK
jgi:hypothetical protein